MLTAVTKRAKSSQRDQMAKAFWKFLYRKSDDDNSGLLEMKECANDPKYFEGGVWNKIYPRMTRFKFQNSMTMDCKTSSPVESANSVIKRHINYSLGLDNLSFALGKIFVEQCKKVSLHQFFHSSLQSTSQFSTRRSQSPFGIAALHHLSSLIF